MDKSFFVLLIQLYSLKFKLYLVHYTCDTIVQFKLYQVRCTCDTD